MKRRLLTRIFAAAMAVMMLALAGCGGTDTSTATTSTETTGKVIRMTTAFADPIDPA